MRRRLPLIALALFAVSTVSGCAMLSKLFGGIFKKPVLAFKSASLADASLADATVNLTWSLANPNPVGLSLAEISYGFFVEDKQVVAGKPPKGLNIEAEGKTDLLFPANVKFQDIVPVLETFLKKDSAKYRAEGTVGFQTPIGLIRFPLAKDGTFEVPKLPQVKFNAPTIKNITATAATIEFPIEVTNKNSFPLPVDLISGGLNIAGSQVGSIQTKSLGALTAKGKQTVTIPLTINFLQAASAALAIQNSRTTQIAFTGQLKSGAASLPLSISQSVAIRR